MWSFFCSKGRSSVVIKCDLTRQTPCEMFKALAPCLQRPVPVGEPSRAQFRKLGLMLVLLKIATSFLQKHGLQENGSLYQDQLSFRVKASDRFVPVLSPKCPDVQECEKLHFRMVLLFCSLDLIGKKCELCISGDLHAHTQPRAWRERQFCCVALFSSSPQLDEGFWTINQSLSPGVFIRWLFLTICPS